MEQKMMLAKEIVSCLSGIHVQIVSAEDGSLARVIQENFYGSIPQVISLQNIETALAEMDCGCIYMLSEILGLTYLVIRIPQINRYLLVGPCCINEFSESRIRSRLRQFQLSREITQRIVMYCQWQPRISGEKLHQLGMLLGQHLLGLKDPVRFQQIKYHWDALNRSVTQVPEQYVHPSHIRQIEMRYEASAVMTEAVKHGNLSLALRTLRSIDSSMTSIVRNPDPLRNAQNFCIVLNTQLRHALEARKIHPYRLDKVSHEIATRIESLKTLEDVAKYYQQIVHRYCELALEENNSHLEPLSRQAVVYIKNHLTDNLTVKGTAKALQINANYLSGKFHQEVGMKFTDFVNQQRTEQAASLLKHTNLQIQQIATTVGYNNASHFARQFLHFYNMTPRDYRKRNKL